jgi:ribosomal protein S27E
MAVTKSQYLTVRCQDCECWLHPRAVPSHEIRCPGRPWVTDIGRTTLVTGELAEQLCRLLPEDLLGRPTFSAERLLSPGPGEFLHPEVCHGIVVASPVPGVSSRVWAQIARAGLREGGESAVRQAMTADGFAELRATLAVDLVECAHCGQALTERGLATHQRTNIACRWGRAVTRVRDLWVEGRRDPWSVPGAPLEWGSLNAKACWRRRLEVVRFPRWTAVLLAPATEGQGRGITRLESARAGDPGST